MTTPEEHRRLERWIDRLLRAQPLRQAPATLEERVMSNIARLWWWRRGFTHWPLAARTLFLVASLGFVPLTLWAIAALRADVGSAAPTALPSAAHVMPSLGIAGALARDLWLALQSIPPHWLESALLLGASLYVTLFALATVAYRTLYIKETSSP